MGRRPGSNEQADHCQIFLSLNGARHFVLTGSPGIVMVQPLRAILSRRSNATTRVYRPDGPFTVVNREVIIRSVERHRLPAIYTLRQEVVEGALMSYGPDTSDIFRRTATYVDRILKGARPDELPVQAPTKFELVINMKTAKALGLEVPSTLSARADEVME
jgi:putative ABC transport system substrate-binding protein